MTVDKQRTGARSAYTDVGQLEWASCNGDNGFPVVFFFLQMILTKSPLVVCKGLLTKTFRTLYST